MMMRLYRFGLNAVLLIIVGGTLVVLHAGMASAQGSTFTQRILPLDCIFETVNDGTGTLYYLTPAQCGVVVTPQVNTNGTTTLSSPTATSSNLVTLGNERPVNFSSAPFSGSSDGGIQRDAPWQRLLAVQPSPANQAVSVSSSAPTAVAVVSGVAATLAIILVIAFVL